MTPPRPLIPSERPSWRPTARTVRSALAALALGALALVACDTGDGTELMEPTSETTLPPPDTSALSSVPLGDVGDDPAADGSGDPLAGAEELEPVAGGSLVLADAAPVGAMELFAPWAEGGPINPLYTCDGIDESPPVDWVGVPEGAAGLALSLVDETETSNGRPFVHWVIAGIDPELGRLDESEVPPGAIQALNFFGDVGYGGPCPPPGETHVYRLTLRALGQQVELPDGTPAAELLDYLDSITIAAAGTTVTAAR